jgi:selenocysteine lyase/cysteine desulfurase
LQKGYSCAIGNISIEGKEANELESFLFEHYKIHTVAINWENIHGVRITPNVYTTIDDLDLLAKGIRAFVEKSKKE